MHLYLVPARGSREDPEGVFPDVPAPESGWVGVYDDETHQYVVKTDEPLEGLDELESGADVGFDYSPLLESEVHGSPLPEDTGAAAGEPPMDLEPVPPATPVEKDPDFIDAD